MQNHQIVTWIRKALRADYYTKFEVELEGKTQKTEGYSSDMVYVKVIMADTDRKLKELHLAVKFGKLTLRRFPLMRDMYRRELVFYSDLLKLFEEHQKDRKVSEPFDALPKCHLTYQDDDMDILFLENLSTKGYMLHPRQFNLNFNHIRLLLKNFAKFHALSFSLKAQKNVVFQKLVDDIFVIKRNVLVGMGPFFKNCTTKVLQNLKESNRADLAKKFDDLIEDRMESKIAAIIDAEVEDAIIIHSDCHCNNFMFKYQDNDKENPSHVAILDWQLARYHSPAVDLSYLLYSLGSKTELSESTELLRYYHEELSKFLKALGNDAEAIFPFNVLMQHWNKYAFYGFVYSCCFMDYNFVKVEAAPSLDDIEDADALGEMLSHIDLDHPELYRKRLTEIVEHYFDNIYFN